MSDLNENYSIVDAYRNISSHYKALKKKPWRDFVKFLNYLENHYALPKQGIVADFGTGNGRNLLVFTSPNWEKIALDISFELISAIEKSTVYPINSDVKSLPFVKKDVDLALCIATLHHLASEEDVLKALREINAVLKPNSYLILSVWRRWKRSTFFPMLLDLMLFPLKKFKSKKWRHGDIWIPWKNEKKEVITKRYYHLFTKRELIRVTKANNFTLIDLQTSGGKNNKDNYFVLLKKYE